MHAPESAYNAKSRCIEWKLEIFFDGMSQEPLVITRNDYLITSEVLEEASASSNTPWGNVSANELSATLRNDNDIFNPHNEESPYFNKIKVGTPVKAYSRPTIVSDTPYDWDSLGIFYVADWVTRSGGISVEITCFDRVRDVLGAERVKMKVLRNVSKKNLIQAFFDQLSVPVVIDNTFEDILIYGYHTKGNKDFLNNVSAGMNAWIFCDHAGHIQVRYMRHSLQVAHTITDNDQIIDISSQQGISLDYDGIQLYLKVPQLSESREILSVRNLIVPATPLEVTSQMFTKQPVADVLYAKLTLPCNALVTWHNATSIDFDYRITNYDHAPGSSILTFYGRIVETADTVVTSGGRNLLKLDNIYVQTQEQFESIRRFLLSWVSGVPPLLEVSVRGNPQFELGQKIRVVSSRFNTDFEGVLVRQNLKYNGGLSGTITLMNSRILEVV